MKWKDLLRSFLFAVQLYLALELLLQYTGPPMDHAAVALDYVKIFMIAAASFLGANAP